MAWSLEGNSTDPEEIKIYNYVKKQSKSKELARTLSRFLSLRKFLDTSNFNDAVELRKNVLYNGKPVFTPYEASQLFKMMSKTGGGQEHDQVELMDNIVRQWATFVYGWTPAFIADIEDAVSPYVFILRTLEYDPTFGPLLGIALDSITAILPVISTTIENLAPEVIGLLPIPEAGPIGAIIGWMVASIFVFLGMIIHISRRHFGQAFIISFGLIPFVGSSLYNAAMSGEKFLTKVAAKRNKLIAVSGKLLGEEVAATLENYIPDPLAAPPPDMPPPPIPSTGTMFSGLQAIAEKTGIPTSIKGAKELAAKHGVPTSIEGAKELAAKHGVPTSIEDAKDLAAKHGVPTSIEGAKDLAAKHSIPVSVEPRGGKQLSRIKHKKKKWSRTQRKLKQ
jgi:hypothetical protein